MLFWIGLGFREERFPFEFSNKILIQKYLRIDLKICFFNNYFQKGFKHNPNFGDFFVGTLNI